MILIEICVALLFICEAGLEKYVIALKNPDAPKYPYLNDKEHAWSLAFAGMLLLTIAAVSGAWWLLPSLVLSRRIFFDYVLKKIRDKPLEEIQGNGWFDGKSREIFGTQGGYKEMAVIIGAKFIYLMLYSIL